MAKYRKGVGAFILNQEGKVLICQRSDCIESWQMPQGGVDDSDTSLEEAILREVWEETKIPANKLKIIGKTSLLRYNFPEDKAKKLWQGKYAGQEQVWFAMHFTGTNNDIDLESTEPQEFIDYKWVDASLITNFAVDFKLNMYENILKQLKELNII